MKSKLAIVLILLLISTSLLCTVSAQNVMLLSYGDTFTYDRYHVWTSNNPQAYSDYGGDFFTRNNSIVTVRIDNVSSTVIGVQINIQYQNGTQRNESMIHNIITGYNTRNTVFGDARVGGGIDLIQKSQKQIDYTETRTYGEVTREVNVFLTEEHGWTMHYNTVHNVTITAKYYYDAQTGMFLESEYKAFIYNTANSNLNDTINYFFVLKDTNLWAAPKPPSNPSPQPLVPNLPLLLSATGILVAVVAVAVVVYLKKHKTSG
jgi:hypothetical protein